MAPAQDCEIESSISSVETDPPISMIPYMSHERKFCKSSISRASHMGCEADILLSGMDGTGRSCCKLDLTDTS